MQVRLDAHSLHFVFNSALDPSRLAAIELNRKSQMVSEAVEEVLNLVQNATQTFKSMISVDSDILNKGLMLSI